MAKKLPGIKRLTIIFLKRSVLFYHIMIAVYNIKPVFIIQPGKHFKAVGMGFFDLFYRTVFPKLVAVPKLQIGEAAPLIIFEGG